MTINIIHDSRRPERWDPLMEELSKQQITDYKIWSPIEDSNNVIRSINISHKQIVQWAKQEGIKEVCIMEDDAMFPAHDGWTYFLSKKPKDFDIYSACNYGPMWKKCTPFEEGKVIALLPIVGLHLYIIHSRYFDTFLSVPETDHIDTIQRGGVFEICYPMASIQRPGFSSNNRAWTDYNVLLKSEDIYGGLHQ